ncbi:MAG: hypothetical protein OXC62_12570 [Aestuariivita sp.]|nr:hypothetical protein [Aestuariivita sp.]
MLVKKTKLINGDIGAEFKEILCDVLSYVDDIDLRDITQSDVAERIQTSAEGRVDILFDTLLNYLMADARTSLNNESVRVRNEFFARDFSRQMRDSKISHSLLEFDISWKRDLRIITGAGAAGVVALSGFVGSAIMEFNPYLKIVGLLATAIASASAYWAGRNLANDAFRRSLKRDITEHVQKAEQQVTVYLQKVTEKFLMTFDEFLKSACADSKGDEQ